MADEVAALLEELNLEKYVAAVTVREGIKTLDQLNGMLNDQPTITEFCKAVEMNFSDRLALFAAVEKQAEMEESSEDEEEEESESESESESEEEEDDDDEEEDDEDLPGLISNSSSDSSSGEDEEEPGPIRKKKKRKITKKSGGARRRGRGAAAEKSAAEWHNERLAETETSDSGSDDGRSGDTPRRGGSRRVRSVLFLPDDKVQVLAGIDGASGGLATLVRWTEET